MSEKIASNKVIKPNQVKQDHITGPGQYLRQMRQMRHWTTTDVAKQLNVITATIESIENDDYRDIGTTVFIKGYLRLYARTVGANENVVIDKFMQTAPTQYCQAEAISVKQPETKENTLTVMFKQWIKTIFKQS